MADLYRLCAPVMEGRLPGSPGELRAADTIAELLGAGAHVTRDRFEIVVPRLTSTPRLEAAGHPFQHLVDFAINVQGAASGGSVHAECVWLGALDGSAPLPEAAKGRVAVGTAPVTADAAAGLDAYLERHRRAHAAGAAALLQRAPRTDRRKLMNHMRERPGLPSFDVSDRVVAALFGPERHLEPGDLGHSVALESPLDDQPGWSAGNLMARFDASPLRLLFCAHYDHVGGLPDGRHFAGAVDNAFGVAVLLELGRVLAEAGRGHGVGLLFSAAEELGLLGAYRAAAELGTEVVVVNLDDLGASRHSPILFLPSREFPRNLLSAEDRRLVETEILEFEMPSVGFADHFAFLARGLTRVAALFGRDAEGDVAHTLEDLPGRIDPERIAAVGRAVSLMALRSQSDTEIPLVRPS